MNRERWRRVEDLYSAAIERNPDERAAFLDQACGEDRELRSEVESLLAQEAQADRLMEAPLGRIAADLGSEIHRMPERLRPGTRLGSYEISDFLGGGGMGEVYRAKDVRLGRTVALKVLPRDKLADPERRRRFFQEARAASALNHPNILVLHEFGSANGEDFLVLEFVDGKRLDELIPKHGMPVAAAVQYALQIAGALEAAHRLGVIHRDLKPANIIVNAAGVLKVLDFGLAKLIERPAESTVTEAEQVPETIAGVILGTPGYMSPEQAEGKPADARSDIFAFGAVLYEMLTGSKAFQRPSTIATLSAILHERPKPIRELAPECPPELERLVERCLRKDPAQRFQHSADLQFALENVQKNLLEPEAISRVSSTGPASRRLRIPILAVAAVSIAIAAFVAGRQSRPTPEPRPIVRSVIPLGNGESLANTGASIAVSRDGRRVAFVAEKGGRAQLYLRALDSLDVRALPGTEGATDPFFSPDGEWLGFFAAGKLQKINLQGGLPMVLCEAAVGRGGTWGPDNSIVFTSSASSGVGLMRIPAAGGRPEPLTRPDALRDETSHRWPEFFSDGRRILFTAWTSAGRTTSRIAVLDIASKQIQVLAHGGSYARLAGSGVLAFSRQDGLALAYFDADKLTLKSEAVPLGIKVLGTAFSGAAQFGLGPSGLLIYAAGDVDSPLSPVWVDRQGSEQPLQQTPAFHTSPRLSPDGARLLLSTIQSLNFDVWMFELARETAVRLTFEESADYNAIWTPDGKRVTYNSNRHGPRNLYWRPADGTGSEERLTKAPASQVPGSWSPDMTRLAFVQFEPATDGDIWLLSRRDGATSPLLRSRFLEFTPEISPDGQWLAYSSNESGRLEVYVMPLAGGAKWKISTDGGNQPFWALNRREMYYQNGDRMMAVEIRTEPVFIAGKPRVLFRGNYARNIPRNYDVTADGQRFLMLKPAGTEQAATELHLALNAFQE